MIWACLISDCRTVAQSFPWFVVQFVTNLLEYTLQNSFHKCINYCIMRLLHYITYEIETCVLNDLTYSFFWFILD